MHKRLLALAAVLILTAASTPSAGRRALAIPGVVQAAALQDISPQVEFLRLGDVYDGGIWQLSIPSSFSAPSQTRPAWTEVRASISLLNTSEASFEFEYAPFIDDGIYPALNVRDARGNLWPITRTSPLEGTMATANLHEIIPGLASRWTVGFQVPTINDAALELEVSIGGTVLASYDLLTPSTVTSWAAPNMPRTRLNAPIDWAPGITVTAGEVGTLTCGDPDIETVTQIFAITLEVENENSFDYFWPGVDLPVQPAIAQWRDGTAARFSVETYFDADIEPLDRFSGDRVLLPTGTVNERAFIFATPRDARLGSFDDLPAGLYIQRPIFEGFDDNGLPATLFAEPLWLDLSGAVATVDLDPRFCDLGFAPAPIQYAYAPVAKYAVAGEALPVDAALQDQRARSLLTDALAATSFYYDSRGATLAGADVSDINAFAPHVAIIEKDATSTFQNGIEIVYIDFDPLNPNFVFLMTESESENWLCTGTTGFSTQFTSTGAADEAAETCFPEAFVQAAASTTTTTTSSTTTTTTAAP